MNGIARHTQKERSSKRQSLGGRLGRASDGPAHIVKHGCKNPRVARPNSTHQSRQWRVLELLAEQGIDRLSSMSDREPKVLSQRGVCPHANLDSRPQLLSLTPHGDEGGARNAGLRRGFRS